jgi:hypothetical protein
MPHIGQYCIHEFLVGSLNLPPRMYADVVEMKVRSFRFLPYPLDLPRQNYNQSCRRLTRVTLALSVHRTLWRDWASLKSNPRFSVQTRSVRASNACRILSRSSECNINVVLYAEQIASLVAFSVVGRCDLLNLKGYP